MAIDTSKEDREILRSFYANMTPKENFDPTFEYQWEYIGANGIYVWQSKSLGWQIVGGAEPENPGMRDASGRCVMGDVVLMRMPKERYERLQLARQALVREQRGDKTREQIQEEIDDKVSRLVGHKVNVSFKFDDRRELAQKRGE